MQRTPEEEIEYLGLSNPDRQIYDLESSFDPTLTHARLIFMVAFNKVFAENIKNDSSDIVKMIEGVSRYIQIHAPSVWRKEFSHMEYLI